MKYGRNMTFMGMVSDNVYNNRMKMGPYPVTASEHLAADKGHLVLIYYMTIIAYTQQLLDMEDLFGTSANCMVGI